MRLNHCGHAAAAAPPKDVLFIDPGHQKFCLTTDYSRVYRWESFKGGRAGGAGIIAALPPIFYTSTNLTILDRRHIAIESGQDAFLP
jgi:hypothetical protein